VPVRMGVRTMWEGVPGGWDAFAILADRRSCPSRHVSAL